MKSGHHEDSKSSGEESDQQDQVIDDSGTRSYGCVFCKRGFTNAQALGGHMNIHRKDRTKNRQPSVPSISNLPNQEHVSPGFSSSISSHLPLYSSVSEANRSYHLYFPVSTSSSRRPHTNHAEELHLIQNPQPLSLFEEDWRTNLSLQIGPTHIEHSEEEKKKKGEEDEPDLELRLGHDP